MAASPATLMATRTLLNLVLLLAAFGLALLAWFRPGVQPGETPRPIASGLAPEQVDRITVERLSRDPLAFRKHEGHWFLRVDDRELPAAEFQVSALLRLLDATSTRHYPAASLDLKSLGLEPPRARVAMDDVDFRFGTTEVLNNRRYVRTGDTVYLIDDQYQHLLNADWSNFVSRQILEGRGAITRIELPDMTIAYTEDNHWRIEPEQPDVGADAVQTFIENWQNATALFTRRYEGGQETGGETITVRTRDRDQPLTLRVVSHSPDLVLARPEWGIQYQLPGSEADRLFTLPHPAPEPAVQPGDSGAAPVAPRTIQPTSPTTSP
jgi:hypothetical protein